LKVGAIPFLIKYLNYIDKDHINISNSLEMSFKNLLDVFILFVYTIFISELESDLIDQRIMFFKT